MPRIDFDEVSRQTVSYFQGLQARICHTLEEFEHRGAGTARFREDSWLHHPGGGGITRVLTDGTVFEKGGRKLLSRNWFVFGRTRGHHARH